MFSKPECPHCARAEALLEERGVHHLTQTLHGDSSRKAKLAEIKRDWGVDWGTFPAIFYLNTRGEPIRFVGGADALVREMAR